MENSYKIILVVILLITSGNLAKNFFNGSSLKTVKDNLELTKKSLDSAISSNYDAKIQIEKMENSISLVKIQKEILSLEIDSIITAYRRKTPKDTKTKDSLIKRIREINENRIILKDRAKHYLE